jgi:hypothetical protein
VLWYVLTCNYEHIVDFNFFLHIVNIFSVWILPFYVILLLFHFAAYYCKCVFSLNFCLFILSPIFYWSTLSILDYIWWRRFLLHVFSYLISFLFYHYNQRLSISIMHFFTWLMSSWLFTYFSFLVCFCFAWTMPFYRLRWKYSRFRVLYICMTYVYYIFLVIRIIKSK